MKRYRNIVRGDVIYVTLDQHPKSSVQSGSRPCIVVSNDKNNQNATTYNVLPCTAKIKENPVHVRILPQDVKGYFEKESDILAEQIVTVDEKKITAKVGHILENSEIMHSMNRALIKQLSLEAEIKAMAEQMLSGEVGHAKESES